MATINGINLQGPTPMFSAYLNASIVTIGSDTGVTLIYDTTLINIGSCYSATTGHFTAPSAGNYFFTYNVATYLTNTGPTYFFTDINWYNPTTTVGKHVAVCPLQMKVPLTEGVQWMENNNSGSCILPLAAGDLIWVEYTDSGATSTDSWIVGAGPTSYSAFLPATFSGYLIAQV